MNKQNIDKLVRCLNAVLSQITISNIESASIETLPEWDSMAGVMILRIIEQEFGVEIQPNEMKHLTSYTKISAFLVEKGIQ